VLRDGLRFVRPYFFDYFAFVKTRWVGATVVDLFTREFTGRPREYYEAALQAGRLRVEDTAMSQGRGRRARLQQQSGGAAGGSGASGDDAAPGLAAAPAAEAAASAAPVVDVPLQDGQRVRHFVHRHEPPVRAPSAKRGAARSYAPTHARRFLALPRSSRSRSALLRCAHLRRHRCWTRPSPSWPPPTPPWPCASRRPCRCTRRHADAACGGTPPRLQASLRLHAHAACACALARCLSQGQYRKNSVMGVLASEARAHTRCTRILRV
jgi:hypothetical protein